MISDIYDTLGDTGLKTIGFLNQLGSRIELWIEAFRNFTKHYKTATEKKSFKDFKPTKS